MLTESSGITEFTPLSVKPLPTPNPDKLSLVLAPEAAALYSQEVVKHMRDTLVAAAIGQPKKYVVIDIGSGTDITAHVEVDGDSVVVSSGNAWGGTQVNEEFSKLLQAIVNDPDFKKLMASGDRTKNMAEVNKLLYHNFEIEKLAFCKERIERNEEMAVQLPATFVRFYEKDLIAGAKKLRGIEYEEDTLYIEKGVIETKLLGPAIDGIIEGIQTAIVNSKDIFDTFYLVGGFGGCKYTHEKVSEAIEKFYKSKGHVIAVNVIVPPEPQLAVTYGAVMWRKSGRI